MKHFLTLSSATLALTLAASAQAYDGTKCKEAGNCWEPKPGYPAQVAGSKYDPKHDVNELNKQSQSIKEMEARNAKRSEILAKTGKFVYDVEGQ
ncbi:methanol dehydrogenase [cytochrome c] subunit [Methylomonas sp. MED-D]|uniref:Methanol dehydrogenase [cytochrome c] subunit 2 n=1 Tax=Methylomonas koyamae TaxID=702114 RepID=A0A177NFT4_9GAMM|nr:MULTISPECIES: methanol dehydrogenase [cytochrome c] subunit [Methylomonas]NJA05233.1 methanol dehydrogenase [Methylococcaceae bacterium WWC4]MDT4331576.1 methanol dehydrogenase [cytochrome c] subunit [Methylomonas sp. MV1]OAI16702.1 methanol dehydrogenase [Methylomonas koyamae]OHX36259.1 methanol dehydrogenase [Methylomonas sp. LWB]WGS84282.1 methanol dehydrogenase [cytochrome c] subunit [Methylomonas sp. UP202]